MRTEKKMTKLSEENKEQLKKVFHCINFLIFMEEVGQGLKEGELRTETLKGHAGFQKILGEYLDIFKRDESFDEKTENKFLKFYKILEDLYDANFKKSCEGKAFHIMFDHSPKTKDE